VLEVYFAMRILSYRFLKLLLVFIPLWITSVAQSQEYNWQRFNEELSLTRGTFYTTGQYSEWLPQTDYCRLVKTKWGWDSCADIDAFVVYLTNSVDTLIIVKPDNSGYVKFDDWKSSDKDESIKQIEDELRKGVKQQSKSSGSNIQFLGWHTYPKLNEQNKFLYYATKLDWDGEIQLNVKASVFDRRGYVEFNLVPVETNVSSSTIERMIVETLGLYKPSPNETYASFTTGDKVSEIGVLGVLATLAGVKWGKVAATGLVAIFLAFAKKGWVLLLLPLFFLGRLFGRKKED